MQILVSGSLAYDRIMDFPGKFADHILPDKIHMLNVCFVVDGLTEKFGGTAGNIAYNLSLLGERPLILSTAGNDFDRYEDWLLQNNLPLVGIKRILDELTASAYITTDMADNQITGFNPGAMKYPSKHKLDGLDPLETLAIVCPGNPEDMVSYSRSYKQLEIPYICDPGQQITSLSGAELIEMVTGSDLLVANDYELEMVSQKTGLGRDELLKRTKAAISTLGENGSLIVSPEGEVKISAVSASKVVDPTGAGDAYRAGLIKGMVLGKSLEAAARMGSTCASYAVEFHGTQEHNFAEEEFWIRHEGAFGGA